MSWRDIPGRLELDEGEALQELAAGKVVLEIGSLFGRSTVCLAEVAAVVHAVDPHRKGNGDFHSDFRGKDSLQELRANLRAAGLERKVVLHVGTVADLWLPTSPIFDLAFIDGDHHAPGVAKDIGFVRRVLRPGAKIAAHDYCDHHAGVMQAIDAEIARHGGTIRRVRSVAIWVPTLTPPPKSTE